MEGMHPLRPRTTLAAAVLALGVCSFGNAAPEKPPTSVYTDLAEDRCKTLELNEEEGPHSVQRCPGAAGYHLLVLDDDARMSVTVVDPAGKEHPLDLWTLVSPNFSSLGNVAEWRMVRRSGTEVPGALIVRFNATDPETSKVTSYLAVAKIADDGICLVEAVPPGLDANEKAREVADGAQKKACLKASLE